MSPQIRKWDQAVVPWFDKPDAHFALAARHRSGHIGGNDAQLLSKWIDEGYFIAERIIPESDIDAAVTDLANVWETDTVRDNLVVNGVTIDGVYFPSVTHRKLLELPKAKRQQVRELSSYRLGDIHLASPAIRRIFENRRMRDICTMVFDGPAEPRNTLYFDKGSEQELHQDTNVFHVHPRNFLIGVWIAFHDITSDSGPLVYYPRSHKAQMWDVFDNYPQTNLRTGPKSLYDEYASYMAGAVDGHERKQALLKKGDALFWHAMLAHGGDRVLSPGASRQSLVIHYMKEGTDKHEEVVGPFNW